MSMRKVIFAAIILMSCFGTCFGQAIKPDTLTIYGTFPVYGREAEWMEDQLNIWKPNLAEIRVVNDCEMARKGVVVLEGHDVRFNHGEKPTSFGDHLTFRMYVKCMPDSCRFIISNINVYCNHKPMRYIVGLSTCDDHLNRSNAWLRKNQVLADSARVYSLSLFHELKESLEQHLNRPLEVRMRRIK